MPVFNQSRSRIIRLIFLVAFLVLLTQLFHLQVISGKYKKLADENAIFRKIVYPSRGIIYDRKGRSILNNTLMFDLMVTPAEVRGVDTTSLCKLLEIDTTEFRKRIVNAILRNGNYRSSVFEGLLSPEKYARLEENMWRFNTGFFIQERPVREYPYKAAAHLLGYIREADSGVLKRSNFFYQLGDYVGRTGLEESYEKVLMGQRGVKFLLRDNFNRIQGPYEDEEFDTAAIAGRALKTSLDIELQQLAEKLMTNKVGAVVAIDPRTGGILAMASGPSFDPNMLTGSESRANFNKLFNDVSSPLLNRAIKGQYPPGSSFKPLGAWIALNEGLITPKFGFSCPGYYYPCGRQKCTHAGGGHADNLRLAMANSCNSYFGHLLRLTVDNPKYDNIEVGYMKWKEYMNSFGLGNRLGTDIPFEDKGLVVDTAYYNRPRVFGGKGRWNSCSILSLGIGQGEMSATPLQLANMMCIIANNGYYFTPHLVDSIENEMPEDTLLKRFRTKNQLKPVSEDAYNSIIEGMHGVVEYGTGRSARIEGINICAKTGTAENYRIIDKKRVQLKDNSMFVCFAPMENPKIAVAVVVENAGFGATWAGPIASLVVEKYLKDSLSQERWKRVDEIAKADLMPSYLEREQRKQDSLRAAIWAERTGDSSFLRKFLLEARQEAERIQRQEEEKRREERRKNAEKQAEKQKAFLNPEDKKTNILRNR